MAARSALLGDAADRPPGLHVGGGARRAAPGQCRSAPSALPGRAGRDGGSAGRGRGGRTRTREWPKDSGKRRSTLRGKTSRPGAELRYPAVAFLESAPALPATTKVGGDWGDRLGPPNVSVPSMFLIRFDAPDRAHEV